MHISELETPALLIDVDIMERNLERVVRYSREHGLRLRPHTKTHKIPELARRQLRLGAVGLTVAKTSEAEVMLQSGTPDLLVAYPVIGASKLDRLMRVAADADVTVAIDSTEAAAGLSSAAYAAGRTIGVLAEVDAGLGRVGVHPRTHLVGLVQTIASLPCLEFRGLAFYPGHIKDMRDESSEQALLDLDAMLDEAVTDLETAGFPTRIVSGGSTPTLFESHRLRRLNEIRPGTYIFNDRNTWLSGACSLSDCAASILVTVVSTSVPGRMIVDGGSKTFSSDRCVMADAGGFGYVPECPRAVFERMNEEHGFFDIRQTPKMWTVGDRLRVVPNHICVAVNLHEQVYAVRGDDVVDVWKVEARGKLQ